MLLQDDGLPGSRFSPLHREGPHGGQRRAPHRPVKATGAPGCGRVLRCAPGHGPGRTRQPSAARPPTPPTPLYPSGEKTQEPRAGQVRIGWTRRGSTVYEGTWLPRARSAQGFRGERHATGRSARGRGARSSVNGDRDISCHGHGVLAPPDGGSPSAGGRAMTIRVDYIASSRYRMPKSATRSP